jgi:hypothetical protein
MRRFVLVSLGMAGTWGDAVLTFARDHLDC